MNPELPPVQPRIETPQIPGATEYYPQQDNIERPVMSPERAPAQETIAPPPAQPQPLPQQSLPTSDPASTQPSESTVATDDDTPAAAADEDLIEKEWVDKAKKILALTREDPYEKSRVIAQLQADYLKKRYNKTLGQAGDE